MALLLLRLLLLLVESQRCDHWRCTGGVHKCRLLLLLHYRMLWRLRRRQRYWLLCLELPEVDDHLE